MRSLCEAIVLMTKSLVIQIFFLMLLLTYRQEDGNISMVTVFHSR
jgi:hypothetical protein